MSPPNSSDFFITLIISLIASVLSAYYAQTKGRSPFAWFIVGFLISFFALIILYFLPSVKEQDQDSSVMNAYRTPAKPEEFNVKSPTLSSVVDSEHEKLWYYLDQNHQQQGPVSMIALKELWDTGRLDLNSYVWSEGMREWNKVSELPRLKDALHKVQPLF